MTWPFFDHKNLLMLMELLREKRISTETRLPSQVLRSQAQPVHAFELHREAGKSVRSAEDRCSSVDVAFAVLLIFSCMLLKGFLAGFPGGICEMFH